MGPMEGTLVKPTFRAYSGSCFLCDFWKRWRAVEGSPKNREVGSQLGELLDLFMVDIYIIIYI